jgi:hypothetical protein
MMKMEAVSGWRLAVSSIRNPNAAAVIVVDGQKTRRFSAWSFRFPNQPLTANR